MLVQGRTPLSRQIALLSLNCNSIEKEKQSKQSIAHYTLHMSFYTNMIYIPLHKTVMPVLLVINS